MKRTTTLLLFCFVSMNLLAQTATNKVAKRMSYGISISGTGNYRMLTSDGSENFLNKEKGNNEIPRISFSGGILLNYRINDFLSINSGINFDDLGFKTREQTLHYSDNTSVQVSTAYHYRYFTVPLDLKYDFRQRGNLNFYIAGGISPALFITKSADFSYGDQRNTDTQTRGFDRFSLMADVSTGIDFQVSRRIKLSTGIFYKQFLNATNSNLPTKEYLNSAGINFSFTYCRYK